MRPLKPLFLTLLLCAFAPSISSAATTMGDYGVSTTGYISTSQIITSNVSLTTGATTWGYISSTGTYLPKLATDRISTTSISTTNLTTEALTVTGTPTANTDATTKAYVDTVIAANCTGSSNTGNSTCQVGRTWKLVGTFGANTTGYPSAMDSSNNMYGWAYDGSSYYLYKNNTKMSIATSNPGNKISISADGQKMIRFDYSGSLYYIYTSTNGGASWTDRSNAISIAMGSSNSYLGNADSAVISGDGSRMLVSGYRYGGSSTPRTVVSTDGGNTWTVVYTNSRSNVLLSTDGSVVLAASNNQISRDGGATWAAFNPTAYIPNGAMSPNGTNLITYTQVGTSICAPMFSKNGGTTWTIAMDVYDAAVCNTSQTAGITNDGMYMQVGSYYSLDGGNTWTKSTGRVGLVSPGSGKVYYTYTNGTNFTTQLSECP